MKIVYLCDENIALGSGVAKKINTQASCWRELGHQVAVISLRSDSTPAAGGLLAKTFKHFSNAGRVRDSIQQENPDIIYSRYIKYAPGFARFLKKIAPYVIEINTNDVAEASLGNRWTGLYNESTRGVFFSQASGLIAVTHELNDSQDFKKYQLPSLVIGNGYDCRGVEQPIEKMGTGDRTSRCRLIFAGSPGMPWHGLDKVVELAQLLPQVDVHIAGPEIREVLDDTRVPPNVTWHGHLPEGELARLIDGCDVGISTLALHRKRMNDACPLKSRQYLAQGLPIIIGYQDPDLKESSDFVLNLGNRETNVRDSIKVIKQFLSRAHSIDRNAIRRFALTHLDYQVKERTRLEFFISIIKKISLIHR